MLTLFFDPGAGYDFEVDHFTLECDLSTPWTLGVTALLNDADIDLESLLGVGCGLKIGLPDWSAAGRDSIYWTGICRSAEVVRSEPSGLSTYYIEIAPKLWLLSLRTNRRVFQGKSALDMALEVLRGWELDPDVRVDGDQPVLDYRVQMDESDLAFASRMLEEAGLTYFFVEQDEATRLVIADKPETAERQGEEIPFYDDITARPGGAFATRLRRSARARPGKVTLRGYDFRRPAARLEATPGTHPPFERGESFIYRDGAGTVVTRAEESDTPTADTPRTVRQVQDEVQRTADMRMDMIRGDHKTAAFETNVFDLVPGHVTSISGHPRNDFASGARLLITGTSTRGHEHGGWGHVLRTRFASEQFFPHLRTEKPRVHGVQTAVVVGPSGDEIHTDEHGRVRVRFHWDRVGPADERASTWVRVSHAWAGTRYGMFQLPRVGQEVLVAFVDGDPDQPVVVGRLHNAVQPPPYALPEHRTVSTWKSSTSPGGEGFNEIKLEDKKDSELFYMRAERDLEKLVRNDERETTKANRSIRVDGDLSASVGGSETRGVSGARGTCIHGDDKIEVKGAAHQRFATDARLTVVGQHDVHVGKGLLTVNGETHHHFKGAYYVDIGGAASVNFGSSRDETVSGSFRISAQSLKLTSDQVVLSAADITLVSGGHSVRIDPAGVTIVGTLVRINSGGSAASADPPVTTAPEDASDADTVCGEDDGGGGGS